MTISVAARASMRNGRRKFIPALRSAMIPADDLPLDIYFWFATRIIHCYNGNAFLSVVIYTNQPR